MSCHVSRQQFVSKYLSFLRTLHQNRIQFHAPKRGPLPTTRASLKRQEIIEVTGVSRPPRLRFPFPVNARSAVTAKGREEHRALGRPMSSQLEHYAVTCKTEMAQNQFRVKSTNTWRESDPSFRLCWIIYLCKFSYNTFWVSRPFDLTPFNSQRNDQFD